MEVLTLQNYLLCYNLSYAASCLANWPHPGVNSTLWTLVPKIDWNGKQLPIKIEALGAAKTVSPTFKPGGENITFFHPDNWLKQSVHYGLGHIQ
jgi:hypothetical protein